MHAGDVQRRCTDALLASAEPGPLGRLLVGGADPVERFAIHRRHVQSSLARSIVERFPATVWLAGSDLVATAARAFVRDHPPERPCMAEYGGTFPRYLAGGPAAAELPYLEQVATIDWHLGRLAIAADRPAITLAGCDPDRIAGARLRLQSGVAYLQIDWSIDELIAFYLSGDMPERYTLRRERAFLELRGSRGDVSLRRIDAGTFVFRLELRVGKPLGEAAAAALATDGAFDIGEAAVSLVSDQLITAVLLPREGRPSTNADASAGEAGAP